MNRNDPEQFRSCLASLYRQTVKQTEQLVKSLAPEDLTAQSMPDMSPLKWHLGHTAWFFETLVLAPHFKDYKLFDANFGKVFNSYYVSLGERYNRAARGVLTRPTVAEVMAYRHHVSGYLKMVFAEKRALSLPVLKLIELGINHEEQHQELMVMDLKHLFAQNPLRPRVPQQFTEFVLRPLSDKAVTSLLLEEGVTEIGHAGEGFAFDNEMPLHKVYIPHGVNVRGLVTNADWLEFMTDGGYKRPEFWLSLGWNWVEKEKWEAPLYWSREGSSWYVYDFDGYRPVDLAAPVCHISYFEADAFARFSKGRLPTEAELEVAMKRRFSPIGEVGRVWEWTSSSYGPYPKYQPWLGAVGEYNGKFMCNQYVLRGGSIASPPGHVRSTYRNFFPPETRWQFSGLRHTKDL